MRHRPSRRGVPRPDPSTAGPATAAAIFTGRAAAGDCAPVRQGELEILSHELRTPVTVILGAATILTRRAQDADAVADLASDIIKEADRLDRLVGNLLAMAGDTAVPAAVVGSADASAGEPVLLQHVLPAVARITRRVNPRCDLRVDVEADLPAVAGEAGDVAQVLRNLVDNACRYDPASGPIHLRARRGDGEVQVEVLDRGAGLEAGQEARIFDLFYRAPSTAGWTTGGGIGLYASAVLVHRMGGRLWAHRRPGGGAEFGFALPVLEAA